MGKYHKYDKRKRDERPWKIHPIWQGIGCLMIPLLLLMSYAAAVVIVQAGLIDLPKELDQSYVLPNIITIPFLNSSFSSPIQGQITYSVIFYFFVFLFLSIGLLSVVYGYMYRTMGPPRYTALDSPPVKTPPRRRYR
jgi:hypothetical protein